MISLDTTYFIILIVVVLVLLSFFIPGLNKTKTRIAGKSLQKITEQQVYKMALSENHVVLLQTSTGINKNLGKTEYGEQARFEFQEYIDLNQGQGTHQGYVTQHHQDGSVVVARFSGEINETQKTETPHREIHGNWHKIRGTQTYAGIQGHGAYSGQYLNEKEYEIHWSGNYFL